MSRRRVLFSLLGLLLLAGGTVTGLAARAALSAAGALASARADLTDVTPADSSIDEAVAALRRADRALAAAEDDLDHWSVDIVCTVPVLGRSWQVERAVARTASHVVDGATVLALSLPAVQSRGGGVDLTTLAAIGDDVRGSAVRATQALRVLGAIDTDLTPTKVTDGRRDAIAALRPAVVALERTADGLGLMGGLLGATGDRSVLVMLQNNAELRGTGGYAASFATGRTSGGRLLLDPLRDVFDVADPPERARRVPAPVEYAKDYGPLSGDTTIWRSWNMSPHVPDSAVVGARVAGVLLDREPDVVVLLDVPGMARLAALRNGVALPDGTQVSADELSQTLLIDAYREAGVDRESQERRRNDLQGAATSALTELLAGDVPVAELARVVMDLAAGRHLTVWSADSEEQAVLVELGIAGALAAPPGGDLSHVSVNNVGANKLDVYVERSVAVTAVVGPDGATVTQRASFANHAPADLVPYVAGYERPGTVMSRVELSLPPTAVDIVATLDGRAWPGRIEAGAARYRLTARVDTPRGATSTIDVRYRVPLSDGAYDLRIVPQPLAEDARAQISVRAVDRRRLVGDDVEDGAVLYEGPLDRTRAVHVRLDDTDS